MDKTGELDSSKDTLKDVLMDSKRKNTAPADSTRSMANEPSNMDIKNATADLFNSEKSTLDKLESEQESWMDDSEGIKWEDFATPIQEDDNFLNKSMIKSLEEKVVQSEKGEQELTHEKSSHSQKNIDLDAKDEDLRKMLLALAEENTRLKNELLNLKSK